MLRQHTPCPDQQRDDADMFTPDCVHQWGGSLSILDVNWRPIVKQVLYCGVVTLPAGHMESGATVLIW